MAEQHSSLSRANRFGLLKAAEIAAFAVAACERGDAAPLDLRVESLGTRDWDDIETLWPASVDRWQVKRQRVALPAKTARGLFREAFNHAKGTNRLYFGLFRFVSITDGKVLLCDLADLAELCERARDSGMTASGLASTTDVRLRSALRYICEVFDDADWNDTFEVLRRLHVVELGTEETLREKGVAALQPAFRNAEKIFEEIYSLFLRGDDGRITFDLRRIYREVIDVVAIRRDDAARWIYLARNKSGATWSIAGTIGLDSLVTSVWGDEIPLRIELGSPPLPRDPVSKSVARLILHRGPSTVPRSAHSEWSRQCERFCAGTLGVSGPAMRSAHQSTNFSPQSPQPDELGTAALAAALDRAMDDEFWSRVCAAITARLYSDEIESTLREAIQARWDSWHKILDANLATRLRFLRSITATAEELRREGFEPATRAGPHLAAQAAGATVMALAVAEVLEDPQQIGPNITPECDSSKTIVIPRLGFTHVIGLAAASHPGAVEPADFIESPGELLAAEEGSTILGVVTVFEQYIYQVASRVPFAASEQSSQNFAAAGVLGPVLTANKDYRVAIGRGRDALRRHVDDVLRFIAQSKVSGIQGAIGG